MTTPNRCEAVAPVAWATPKQMEHFSRVRAEDGRDTWADVWLRERQPYTTPLYSADTVSALQWEVQRLREERDFYKRRADAAYMLAEEWNFEARAEGFGGGNTRAKLILQAMDDASPLNLEPPTDGR